tara:strand:+ start:63 stop:440 length:378 start_codon:yes stop_codon:yes gene_type:complete
MAKKIRINVYIKEENFNLTYKQLLNKLSKLDYYDFLDFFENNPTENFDCFNTKRNNYKLKGIVIDEINGLFDSVCNIRNEQRLDNMMYNRQMERTSSDQPIYPQGWYEKQDKEIIWGKERRENEK